MRKVVTWEEHDQYVHLCGRTGLEAESLGSLCVVCNVLRDCLLDHCTPELAGMSDEAFGKVVDMVVSFIRR
jgi:hypothetical protein